MSSQAGTPISGESSHRHRNEEVAEMRTSGDSWGPRLGRFGGTFDPSNVGHLVTAVNVRYYLRLDRVLLVVNNVPWQKHGSREITPAEDRLGLVEAAVADVEGIEIGRAHV